MTLNQGEELTLHVRDAIQRELDKMEECATRNLIKFSKDECQVLLLGRKTSPALIKAGARLAVEQLC